MSQELITVGGFEVERQDLSRIAELMTRGESEETIAQALGIRLQDVSELLAEPELYDAVIEHRKKFLKMVLFGPIAEKLAVTAASAGDARARNSAAKLLATLLSPEVKKAKKNKGQHPLNLFLSGAGYSQVVQEIARKASDDDVVYLEP